MSTAQPITPKRKWWDFGKKNESGGDTDEKDENFYRAGQWQLVWWKFRRHKLAQIAMVVLGGMGHIPGVILGAVLLSVLPEALRYIGPLEEALFGRVIVDPADLRLLLFGLAMVLVMLLRPAGLWPSPVRQREFSGHD